MSHRRRRGDPGPEITLPITPMLDMSFQLLFFFMATFNPTDPEGAQVLAMAREKKVEDKKTDKMATDPKKVRDEVGGGGKQPITLTDGGVKVGNADTLQDADLRKRLEEKLEERKSRAKIDAIKVAREGTPAFDAAVDAELAKQKVRIQTTMDVPWGEVFDAMNLCTRVGFKTVALSTPKDYVPRVPPKE